MVPERKKSIQWKAASKRERDKNDEDKVIYYVPKWKYSIMPTKVKTDILILGKKYFLQ